jgi:hypothetical protein
MARTKSNRLTGVLLISLIVFVVFAWCTARVYRQVKIWTGPVADLVVGEVSAMKAGVGEMRDDVAMLRKVVTEKWARMTVRKLREWVACRIAPDLCKEPESK